MDKLEKVIKGLECRCYNQPDKDCEHCTYGMTMGRRWGCDFVGLCGDALELLKAQKLRKRLEVHNIGNVDIPEGVTMEQFHAVMNNVVLALEHTDKGESWPYEEENDE